jgi:hypothetical protein
VCVWVYVCVHKAYIWILFEHHFLLRFFIFSKGGR